MLPSKDDVISMYNKVSSRVKQYALNMTPLELKVDEATSAEPWGPHGTTMAEISRAAFDYENYKQIMGVIARRLQSEGENWRHVYKSLLLLEYMTKHGPQKVVDELSSNLSVIEKLQRFEYLDKNSKDWGLNVRQRAKELCNLISNPERVRNERQKAKQNESKYTGVSADESRMGFGFGSTSSSGFAGGSLSTFGGGSALSGMGGGGSSALGGKGYGASTGFASGGGAYDTQNLYDDDLDSGHQPLSAEDVDLEDEDAREATRKRIESLRQRLPESGDATKTTPLKGGRAPQLVAEAESKAPKRLSQVRVNPSIAASLGVSSRGASPAPQAPGTTQRAPAAPALDLFGDSEPAPAPAAPAASASTGPGSSWDAFREPQTAAQPPAAGQEDWSSLLDGRGAGAPAPPAADPFAALAGSPATAAPSADPFAGPAGMSSAPAPADPFANFSSVQKRAAGPMPLAPAPQKPVQDPFAALTSASDPFAPPAPKAHSPLKAAGFGQAARPSDPFAPSPSAVTGSPAGSGTLSASTRAGQALPEDMFAAPLPAPVFGLGAQSFTGAKAGSPNMQSASPTRFGQPANNGGFGAFAAAQAGGSRTEDLFGSMSISGTKPQGPSAEALGGGVKMAPNLPQPSMPPPVTKKDPFAGLAGF